MMPTLLTALKRQLTLTTSNIPTLFLVVCLTAATLLPSYTEATRTTSLQNPSDSRALLAEAQSLEAPQQFSALSLVNGDHVDKRAPSGFMGMRGKKTYYDDLESERQSEQQEQQEEEYYQDWEDLQPSVLQQSDRKPQKLISGGRDKKAPSGFMGMRGKKAPSGFLGLRGKKQVPQNLPQLLQALSNRYRNNYGYKRAPLGFLGMRGRRTDPSLISANVGFGAESVGAEKRAPYGFMGMRG